ncbi:MAG: hypothetical protein ABEJ72_04810 [Candidatus Aenigmatarchaeota archaeon]
MKGFKPSHGLVNMDDYDEIGWIDGKEDTYLESRIEIVEREYMPENVLGRAHIYTNKIEIDSDLRFPLKEKVKQHEIEHIRNPLLSEKEVRVRTDTTEEDIRDMRYFGQT